MKKIATLIMTALLLLTSVFAFTACGNGNESAITDGKLTVGYTIYAPMNYLQEENNNEFVGFDTELAKAFCEEIGVEVEFKEINWDNKFIDLESKAIDCIWNGMTITEEAKEKTAVSDAYLENKQVVVCRAADIFKYTTKQSILNATSVAFEGGSAGEKAAVAVGGPEAKQNKATAQRDTLLEVKTSASDIAIIDLTMAKVLVGPGTSYSDLVYIDVGFDIEEFGVAFRKSDAGLAKAFDLFVKMSKQDLSFAALQLKYFS